MSRSAPIEMNSHRRLSALSLALLFALVPAHAWSAGNLLVGDEAPPFVVESGNGEKLTLSALQGKIVVLFYENRDAVKKNVDVKDRLNTLYEQNAAIRNTIFRLAVFDCSHVTWPMTLFWRDALRRHSARLGFTLYGDWDGRMFEHYSMRARDSNVFIIDRKGRIRYTRHGQLREPEYNEIYRLLHDLVYDEG